MKRTVLALVSVLAAVGAYAQANTGGTVTFKVTKGVSDLIDRVGAPVDPSSVGQTAGPAKAYEKGKGTASDLGGFYGQLLWSMEENGSYVPAMGRKVGGSGNLELVVEKFFGTTGKINGGDWALDGVAQGVAVWFKVGAFYSPDPAQVGWATQVAWPDDYRIASLSSGIRGTTGGNDVVPPATAFNVKDIPGWSVTIPEPSVMALGVLGLGAFLLRRRS